MPVPVVVGVGQVTHRDDDDVRDAEPLALIAAAALARRGRRGRRLLAQVDAIDLMPVGAWSYDDLGASGRRRGSVSTSRPPVAGSTRPGARPRCRALDDAAARDRVR